jgi:hypothetical protein
MSIFLWRRVCRMSSTYQICRGLDGLIRENEVVLRLVLDHLAPEAGGDHVDRLVPALREHLLERVPRGLLRCHPEVHQASHHALGAVGATVAAFGHGDPVDPVAPAAEGEREAVGDAAGIAARGVEVDPALLAGLVQCRGHLGVLDEGEPVGAGRDDVDAGFQQTAHLLGAPGHRTVENAIGVEGHDLVDVLGRDDSGRVDTDDLPRVATLLVVAVDLDPDEVEPRVPDDAAKGGAPHDSGGPLDDPVPLRHGLSFPRDRGVRPRSRPG